MYPIPISGYFLERNSNRLALFQKLSTFLWDRYLSTPNSKSAYSTSSIVTYAAPEQLRFRVSGALCKSASMQSASIIYQIIILHVETIICPFLYNYVQNWTECSSSGAKFFGVPRESAELERSENFALSQLSEPVPNYRLQCSLAVPSTFSRPIRSLTVPSDF